PLPESQVPQTGSRGRSGRANFSRGGILILSSLAGDRRWQAGFVVAGQSCLSGGDGAGGAARGGMAVSGSPVCGGRDYFWRGTCILRGVDGSAEARIGVDLGAPESSWRDGI